MTTPPPSPTSRIEEAFARELKDRTGSFQDVAKEWVAPWPASLKDKSREELARCVAQLDPKLGRARLLEAVDKSEAWFVQRLDAFVRTLATHLSVEPKALRSADDAPATNWLAGEVSAELDAVSGAMDEARNAAFALASQEAAGQAAGAAPGERVEKAFALVTQTAADFDKAMTDALQAGWKTRTDKLKARAEPGGDDTDPAAHTRRAAERAAASLKADQSRKQGSKKRRWYHWVIDITLIAVSAYLIKTRFFPNKDDQPPPAPSSSAAAAAPRPSGSAAHPRVVVNPTRMLQGPGYHFAPVEALSAAVRAELLEPPQGAWVHVRVGHEREGWVPLEAVSDPDARHARDAGAGR